MPIRVIELPGIKINGITGVIIRPRFLDSDLLALLFKFGFTLRGEILSTKFYKPFISTHPQPFKQSKFGRLNKPGRKAGKLILFQYKN